MKYLIPLTLLMASLASATVVTTTVAGAAAIIIGAKILVGKGFVYGAAKATFLRSLRERGSHRGRREVEADLSDAFLEASQKDQYDCFKSLVCELHAKPLEALEVIHEKLFLKHEALKLNTFRMMNLPLPALSDKWTPLM